ncbi:MAG: glycosyltransferase [Deltaproteobacteria bacterium]|nr:glycosyltransferase [Deltaproteobacteria bacterium]
MITDHPSPRYAVIIPARDEEQTIGKCLRRISDSARLAGVPLEIIVVLNRCSDRTEEIARAHGARIAREDARNLSIIRNAGARETTADVLVFIDADSVAHTKTFTRIKHELAQGAVGGGCLILPERWSLGILLTGLCLLPIALRNLIGGGLFFCRKVDFDLIEGFDEKLSSAEDIDFAKRLKAHGARTGRPFRILLAEYIVTSCRKFDRLGDWYFVTHPFKMLTLLKGRNQSAADEIWYDFPREPQDRGES